MTDLADPSASLPPYPVADDPLSADPASATKAVSAVPQAEHAEDAALLSAVAAGDREAYRELHRRYASILLGLLDRILGDRGEAEETLQEVFLQIWKKAAQFDRERGRALPWLATIARNRALDRKKILESRRRLTPTNDRLEPVEPPDDPAERADFAEEARRLRAALAAISEAQRRVLTLAYFDGLSQSEIADRLGAPLGTVKSHARIGLAKLRELLRASGGGRRFEET
jgi:RNA polymerase sigma-70 factor (ECF subfamily)